MNNWASLSDSGGAYAAGRAPSPQSPKRRVRSRSLSSPSRSPGGAGSGGEGAKEDARWSQVVGGVAAVFRLRDDAGQLQPVSSGMNNWASLSDSGGAYAAGRAPSPQSPSGACAAGASGTYQTIQPVK
ncbi:hypothetical protein MSG28_011580 [Choristoneura fumiferana]|uniref:Uncharacterized protein n=1 Tax=Choristoneura fumiferana TaxID=7141 RepID=A0ACC0JNR2_CHOFU|nr:hypothetical protein MSG28_011580 [Choristoneura fumiferana]